MSTPSDPAATPLPPNKYVAQLLLEHMQKSGHRDHIKEWLLDDLESKGWKSRLFERAAQVANIDPEKQEESEQSEEKDGAEVKARDIGKELLQIGHESVPNSVRVKLFEELLALSASLLESPQFRDLLTNP